MNKTYFEIALAGRGVHTTTALSDLTGISRQTLTRIRSGNEEASQESAEQLRIMLKLTNEEYKNIFPMQAEITGVREKYLYGNAALYNLFHVEPEA